MNNRLITNNFLKVISIVLLISLSWIIPVFSQDKPSEFESDIIKVAIVASDLKLTLDFYTNVIGMTNVREFDIDNPTSIRFGLSGGIPFHVSVLKLDNVPQATELKIMSFAKQPKHKKSKYIQDDIGVQYLTIYVNSITPFLKRIKSNNIKLLGQTPTTTGDKQYVLIQDPNGVFIELIEH